jgi:hypothetical protein
LPGPRANSSSEGALHGGTPRLEADWCVAGNGWEWGNGMIITSDSSDYGSFPHSLLNTIKNRIF